MTVSKPTESFLSFLNNDNNYNKSKNLSQSCQGFLPKTMQKVIKVYECLSHYLVIQFGVIVVN